MMEPLDQVLARVVGEIWTSNGMYENLAALCGLGTRLAGSEGERRAREFVTQRLHDYGLQEVRSWEFGYLSWQRGACEVEVVSPQSLPLRAIALLGSPSTADGGLEAEVVALGMGTLGDFQRRAEEIPGKVVAVTSASPSGASAVHRREKYGWAVERGAAGFVFVNHLPAMPAATGSLRPGRPGEIPAVSLPHEDGMALMRLAQQGGARIRLNMRNGLEPARAQHVFADIPGNTDETLILSAHYDGHDISPAALDNGSGVVTVLELARLLAPYAGTFRRGIRVALWTVEEWGVYGSEEYLDALPEEELARIALVINLDVTSGIGTPVWSLNGFGELAPLFQQFARDMGYEYLVSEEVTTGSDHFPFVLRGVPAVWLRGAAPPETSSRRFILTPADTLDKVLSRDMKESAMLAAQVLIRAANQSGPLPRHLTRDETLAVLRRQGMEESLRAQGKWPQ